MEKIRTFIAIPLPPEIKAGVGTLQGNLKKVIQQGVGWVACESLHITVKFIGSLATSLIPEVQKLMADHASSLQPFVVTIEKVGVFPHVKNARIIWVGIIENLPILAEIHRHFNNGLSNFGVEKEAREYSSHITIGRVKKKQPADIVSSMLEKYGEVQIGKVKVDSLVLFQSILKPTGPVYSPLSTVNLG